MLPRALIPKETATYGFCAVLAELGIGKYIARERRSDRPVHDGIHSHIAPPCSSRGPPFAAAEARYNAPGACMQYVIPMHGLYLANKRTHTHKHEPEKGDISQRRRRTLANWRWHRHTERAKGKTFLASVQSTVY
uniref:Uncharacterized protein n=1 Tax=Trichogramma kaykai TaxID=54128 RepID=A0ABD2WX37_9HYME